MLIVLLCITLYYNSVRQLFMAKKLVSFRIDEDTINALSKQAEKENRSLSNLIEIILKEHLKKKRK